MSDRYSTIRDPELLGPIVGARVVDITQHDRDEFQETRQSYFCLHFDNGYTLTVPVGDDGFVIESPAGDIVTGGTE